MHYRKQEIIKETSMTMEKAMVTRYRIFKKKANTSKVFEFILDLLLQNFRKLLRNQYV